MRPSKGGRSLLLTLALFSLEAPSAGHGFSQGHGTSADARDPASSPATCESKTINYITHTLPQQCLRTSWSSANSTVHTEPVDTTATTAAATSTAGKQQPEQTSSAATQSQSGTPRDQGASEGKRDDGDGSKDQDPAAKKDKEDKEDDVGDLATSSFMSFEEWKAMMLKKAGQDPESLKARKHHENRDADPNLNGGLDSWGDDGEIALDFDALSDKISEMTATASATASPNASKGETQDPVLYDDGVAQYPRPKDAGKTCKERFSFSSFDAGATVLKTSPGAKNSKAILVENKDSYMLFACAQENKFVIVELSEDILVDTVVLANFEFFSSMIRNFRVSVSDRFPIKMDKWKTIGTFEARNSRDIQAFLVENPKIWAKYIRIEFLTQYGNEYYCPVSLLRVHGTRMLDSWKDAEAAQEEEEQAETVDGPETVPSQSQEPVPEEAPQAEPEPANATEQILVDTNNKSVGEVGLSPWYPTFYIEPSLQTCAIPTPTTTETVKVSPPVQVVDNATLATAESSSTADLSGAATSAGELKKSAKSTSRAPENTSISSLEAAVNASIPASSLSSSPPESTATRSHTQVSPKFSNTASSTKSSVIRPMPRTSSRPTTNNSQSKSSTATNNTSHPLPRINNGQNRTSGSTTSSAAPSPTVQESFFKTVSKRLQLLESNTTLSLQYIEDQSRFLQDALQKMERKQIHRVDSFLDSLNNTVLSELRNVRQQYDQIWQSTVIALETQREQSQREIVALSSRLNLLADEVVFQKRMAILQSVLLLCCLVLVIFSRGVLGAGTLVGNTLDQWAASSFMNPLLASPLFPSSPQSGGRRRHGLFSAATSAANSPEQRRRRPFARSHSDQGGAGASLHPSKATAGARQQRTLGRAPPLARPLSYTDKMLPMTPTSECNSGDDDEDTPTPPTHSHSNADPAPTIQVDEPDEEDFVAREEGQEEGEEDADAGDATSDEAKNNDLAKGKSQGDPRIVSDVESDDDGVNGLVEEDLQPSRPPLTRSPLSELGNARKPLPALPEDPS